MFAIGRGHQGGSAPRTAIYLRAYPLDVTGMEFHRRVLEDTAVEAGLPGPEVFLDNGRRARDGLPALDTLLRAVRAGLFETVLVPGPFVFGLDDAWAQAVVEELQRHSCRLFQLPARSTFGSAAGPATSQTASGRGGVFLVPVPAAVAPAVHRCGPTAPVPGSAGGCPGLLGTCPQPTVA
ncbi:recombinase family protein [Kitasatospora sp. NPDC057015]|uniref:recombinase family protein n=1 Tax=Kitasatospora sp. NPDC057015 TaxID=3346001 RepID=UPI00362F4FE9